MPEKREDHQYASTEAQGKEKTELQRTVKVALIVNNAVLDRKRKGLHSDYLEASAYSVEYGKWLGGEITVDLKVEYFGNFHSLLKQALRASIQDLEHNIKTLEGM